MESCNRAVLLISIKNRSMKLIKDIFLIVSQKHYTHIEDKL